MSYVNNPKCKTCLYSTRIGDYTCCYYAELMEETRGCSVDKCDKYEPFDKQKRRVLSGVSEHNTIQKWLKGWSEDDRFRD